MTFAKSVAMKAFAGYAICHHAELRISGAKFLPEHQEAIRTVVQDYADFCDLIRSELARWPLTKSLFEDLLEARLQQCNILASDFVSRLLDQVNPLEDRLSRLQGNVKNLNSVMDDWGAPSDPNAGEDTDKILLDVWNEIFVMDFILFQDALGFANIEKVVRQKGQPQVDLIAQWHGKRYAIEITRIRKRDFSGSTMPNLYDAIHYPANLESLRKALRNKLKKKNEQMRKFCLVEPQPFDRRLVVLKTSQFEYQDGHEVVRDETRSLFQTGEYPSIDEILLIYDTVNYDWLK